MLPEGSPLRGKAAIANAKLAYQRYLEIKADDRWQALAAHGARVQRPLWASTGTKNPAYSDVLYIDNLIGPECVNTMPDPTIAAFLDHGVVERTVDRDVDQARRRARAAARGRHRSRRRHPPAGAGRRQVVLGLVRLAGGDAAGAARPDRRPRRGLSRPPACDTKEGDMELAMIGLGRMGGNMAHRLTDAGHTVVGWTRSGDESLATAVRHQLGGDARGRRGGARSSARGWSG